MDSWKLIVEEAERNINRNLPEIIKIRCNTAGTIIRIKVAINSAWERERRKYFE